MHIEITALSWIGIDETDLTIYANGTNGNSVCIKVKNKKYWNQMIKDLTNKDLK